MYIPINISKIVYKHTLKIVFTFLIYLLQYIAAPNLCVPSLLNFSYSRILYFPQFLTHYIHRYDATNNNSHLISTCYWGSNQIAYNYFTVFLVFDYVCSPISLTCPQYFTKDSHTRLNKITTRLLPDWKWIIAVTLCINIVNQHLFKQQHRFFQYNALPYSAICLSVSDLGLNWYRYCNVLSERLCHFCLKFCAVNQCFHWCLLCLACFLLLMKQMIVLFIYSVSYLAFRGTMCHHGLKVHRFDIVFESCKMSSWLLFLCQASLCPFPPNQ